jgi:hypothetical protein
VARSGTVSGVTWALFSLREVLGWLDDCVVRNGVITSAASLMGGDMGRTKGDRWDKGIACPAEVGEATRSDWRLVVEGTPGMPRGE